jgi:acid phosphatase
MTSRPAVPFALAGLLAGFLAGWLAAVGPAAAAPLAAGDPLAKIGHIVIIFEENRSFDNLFGRFPGADGLDHAGAAARQVDQDGHVYETLPPVMNTAVRPAAIDPRFPAKLPNAPFDIGPYVPPNETTGDLVHRFYQEQLQIDGGRMDKFAAVSNAGGLVMGHYDLPHSALWRLAREFTLADRMFHSAFGGSMLNHTFLVCACALVWPDAPKAMVAVVDGDGTMVKDGAVSPDGHVINTARSVYLHPPGDTDPARLVPPQTMPHIGDRLDAKAISWKWYGGGYDDALAGHPDPTFQFHHQPLAYFKDLAPGTPAQKAHLQDLPDLYRDIAAGTLPQVAFYKPIGRFNMHPGYSTIADGDAHLDDLVKRLQASPQYRDMLIIVTFDEHGGFWDHVTPPIRDRWGPGTRIPLIAIGQAVKRGFVDPTRYDFGSILKTLEVRFDLEPLNAADAGATPLSNLLQ